MEIFGYLAIVSVGVVLACIGAGGSMLAIPILVYLFSIDMMTASAYSLFLVGITSLAGAFIKQKIQQLDVRAAIMFGIPSIAVTFMAQKWIIGWLPNVIWQTEYFRLMKDDLLLCIFSCLMIASGVMMLADKKSTKIYHRSKMLHLLPGGVFVGVVAGSTGVGGGFLILPAMTLAGLRFKTAVGTTLMTIAFNSLLGFCGHLSNHAVDWHFLLSLTILALSGLLLGEWSSRKIYSGYSWKKSFAWFSLATGTCILIVRLTELFSMSL